MQNGALCRIQLLVLIVCEEYKSLQVDNYARKDLQILPLGDCCAALLFSCIVTGAAKYVLDEHNRHGIGPLKPGARTHLHQQIVLVLHR